MVLRAPESKNGDHFFTRTPPQNGGLGICFMCLPRKVIFGHYIDLQSSHSKIPFEVEKSAHMGRKGPGAKFTKTVLKSVSKMHKLGRMPNLKFSTLSK